MPGEFKKIGETAFPGRDDIRCSLYEWRSLTPEKHGHFHVRFLSPDGECGPRRYWVEPMLHTWMDGKDSRFLERACDYGYKILAELEQHDGDTRDAYHVAKLIFRNRNAGHVHMGRRFKSAADFVDFSRPGSPQLILSGLGGEGLQPSPTTSSAHGQAADLLRKAFRSAELGSGRLKPNFDGVIQAYEHYIAESTPEKAEGGRNNRADDIFVVQTIPHPNRAVIEKQVRSALIAGPVSEEDFRRVDADDELVQLFRHNIERKALDGCSALEFDRWLERVRNEGYLQLVGGRKLQGAKREQAKAKAQRIFCWLLWKSYHMMAKCYGALMTLVSVDFASNNKEGPPDQFEQLLFDLEHRQVDFLSGLPLAFLGASQLRWIVRRLHMLEACLAQGDFDRYQATWGHREDAFANIPALLGIFGGLSHDRRVADRKTKDRKRNANKVQMQQVIDAGVFNNRSEASEEDPAKLAAELEESNRPLEQLHSLVCPKAGCCFQLKLSRLIDEPDPGGAIVAMYCGRCDETTRYTIDPASFSP